MLRRSVRRGLFRLDVGERPYDTGRVEGFDRRALLRFALGSPLWLAPCSAASLEPLEWLVAELARGGDELGDTGAPVRSPDQAVNVFDFHEVARRRLSAAHYTFLSMGVEHEVTLRRNREAFAEVALRPRRLVDVRELDTRCELLGQTLSSPIVLAPAGGQAAFHPEAERAVARAARAKDHLQMLSTFSSTSLEEVVDARGQPVWFQLYAARVWPATRWQLQQAEQAGCPAVVLTVDTMGAAYGENRDRMQRFRRADNPACQSCHGGVSRVERALRGADRAADALGIDLDDWLADLLILDWDTVDRIRDATDMKLLVKGILTAEDARLCVEHGVDGLVVSNHGGRAEDSGLATIEVLPEITEAVGGRIPVLVDSGFRRGTDVFKALAFGATAVAVGRPYLWGLSAFGQEGVEAVLSILRAELETTMKQMGTPSLADITSDHVRALSGADP